MLVAERANAHSDLGGGFEAPETAAITYSLSRIRPRCKGRLTACRRANGPTHPTVARFHATEGPSRARYGTAARPHGRPPSGAEALARGAAGGPPFTVVPLTLPQLHRQRRWIQRRLAELGNRDREVRMQLVVDH